MEWLTDSTGNRCSVEYFGSREAAQRALESLSGCKDCENCSDCMYCNDCSGCSGCSGCTRCEDCTNVTNSYSGSPSIPNIPNIHTAVYAAASKPGALDMSDWHTCKNTHCRAGWVIALAGNDGKNLEDYFHTKLAAMLIYKASSPSLPVFRDRFYDGNTAALADMKRMAELEAAQR